MRADPDPQRKASLRKNPKQTTFLSLEERVTDDYDDDGAEGDSDGDNDNSSDSGGESRDRDISGCEIDSQTSFRPNDSDEVNGQEEKSVAESNKKGNKADTVGNS